jgi:hypothetical protein
MIFPGVAFLVRMNLFYRMLNMRKQFYQNVIMKKFLTERFAINGLLTILSLFVIFHLLVIIKIIPFEIVWGGRLKDQSQMLTFETFSAIINMFMLYRIENVYHLFSAES